MVDGQEELSDIKGDNASLETSSPFCTDIQDIQDNDSIGLLHTSSNYIEPTQPLE